MDEYIKSTIEYCRRYPKYFEDEKVLHVGCGDGLLTTKVVVQLFGDEWIIGTDVSDVNLSAAMKLNQQRVDDYFLLDITNRDEVENFKRSHGLFSRILCLSCSNWIGKPEEAVHNINILLEEDGVCYFAFVAASDVYRAYEKLIDPECNFVQDYQKLISPCHTTDETRELVKKWFKQSGIHMANCTVSKQDIDVDDGVCITRHIEQLKVLLDIIPPNQKETFEQLCLKAVSDLKDTPVVSFQTVFVYTFKFCDVNEVSTDDDWDFGPNFGPKAVQMKSESQKN